MTSSPITCQPSAISFQPSNLSLWEQSEKPLTTFNGHFYGCPQCPLCPLAAHNGHNGHNGQALIVSVHIIHQPSAFILSG